jgi:hypothetical protein
VVANPVDVALEPGIPTTPIINIMIMITITRAIAIANFEVIVRIYAIMYLCIYSQKLFGINEVYALAAVISGFLVSYPVLSDTVVSLEFIIVGITNIKIIISTTIAANNLIIVYIKK